ncbi:methyltransferase-like protein 22 [Aethina tumida]|uniref:methyltransferase-like protein 22 n=1 Tax=Aethina tumida TaxID=116153 RepID=UPI0021484830|nr:methyltransferase-like protein 22 [Aethina tumida]
MSHEEDEDYKVSSEIYEEFDYTSTAKPIVNKNNTVSKFVFTLPTKAKIDPDGDLEVTRRHNAELSIQIEHSKSTVLNLVGLQIWRGALLLADWLIFNAENITKDSYILELGAGVGFTSIVASMFAPVYCSDVNRSDLFQLIESNYNRNKSLTKFPLKVVELDFLVQTLPNDIVNILPQVSLIIAADVVYDDIITKAFVNTIEHLLSKPPQRSVIVALEKRYVFTLAEFDSVAPCYDYFIECLENVKNIKVEQIKCDFPQYFKYERVEQLVLWKVTSNF